MSTQNKIITKKSKKTKIILIIENDEFRFPDELWNIIKNFAGYSNNYPIELNYYKIMLGVSKNFCQTKMKWKRVKSLEAYIDRLEEIAWDYEEDLKVAFAPKQKPKSWEQMRIEWDTKYGEGSFDFDCY